MTNDITACNWWLMKSEPDVYSIDHLKKEESTLWDGIRNYQARNYMRIMKSGDKVFFYHSNCKVPGIVGLMEVTEIKIIDPTQFNKNSKYFDPKSPKENPRWDCARLSYLGKFQYKLSLEEIKNSFIEEDLPLIKKGNRLSIIPLKQEIAKEFLKKTGNLLK